MKFQGVFPRETLSQVFARDLYFARCLLKGQGSLNYLFGGIKQCKCMVIFWVISPAIVHSLGFLRVYKPWVSQGNDQQNAESSTLELLILTKFS